MKWHDASKEWPDTQDEIIVYTNNTIGDRYIFCLGNRGENTLSKIYTDGPDLDYGDSFFWCYTNDIPKPEEQK